MLTRKEMEEMLPDFALGKLEKEMADEYEMNLPDYPDMMKDVEEARQFFQKVEKMNVDKILDSRTRNLSIKVNSRRSKAMNLSGFGYLLRFGVPAVVMLVIAVIFYNQFSDNSTFINQESENTFTQKLDESLKFDDVSDDSYADYEYLNNTLPPVTNVKTELVGASEINELYTENSEEQRDLYQKVSVSVSGDNYLMYDEVEKLSEDEFQILLEEIRNVKI